MYQCMLCQISYSTNQVLYMIYQIVHTEILNTTDYALICVVTNSCHVLRIAHRFPNVIDH